MRKILSILLVLVMLLSISPAAFAEEAVTELPRNEVLYFNGQQWGAPATFNPFAMSNIAFPVGGEERFPIYEALYMYNMLTNEAEPLLADGPIVWEDEFNILVKIKEAAKWNDGEALNADDVVFTINIANENGDGFYTPWSNIWTYLEKCEKVDDYTVRFTLVEEPYNNLMVPSQLCKTRIIPEHIWAPMIENDFGGDVVKLREYFNEEPVGSGAYKLYYYDDTRIICIRDDNYWGQSEDMFGKLAEPKYIAHNIYNDNAAGDLAFSAGQVDVAQQFMPNVWDIQESLKGDDGETLVTTYLEEAPYHLGAGMPSLIINLEKPGLDDPVVRKAIALCLDYEAIGVNAMSSYTEAIVPSLFNPYLFGDYVDSDDEELQALRWDTTKLAENIDTANAMLDEAGYADIDGDGFRELPDGGKIEWQAECPHGWADWNASLEILCDSASKIGLNITTYFPEASVYWDDLYPGNYDIAMNTPYPGLSLAAPWHWAYQVLYSEGVPPIGENANRNFNRYSNERVDELIDLIAGETDQDLIVEYFTEIDKIFLTDLPTIPLMYRPQVFHTTYEGIWTGFAKKDDGKNTPPMDATDAAGIKDLYNITLK